jgi:UDP-N-acetylglucosamine 2-epimerase (non-hydrolysing)
LALFTNCRSQAVTATKQFPTQQISVLHVVGARSNFMKIAPLIRAMAQHHDMQQFLVHASAQHDANLPAVFFQDLGIPEPDFKLCAGPASSAVQIRRTRQAFDAVIHRICPDVVVVVGDANCILACGRAARSRGIRLARLEAGLRSFDASMPEERNRIALDEISDLLLVTEAPGLRNLEREGVAGKYFHVGSMMVDSLLNRLPDVAASQILISHSLQEGRYVVAALQQPSNVDAKSDLVNLIRTIQRICEKLQVVLPLHRRTHSALVRHDLLEALQSIEHLSLTETLGHVDFLRLVLAGRAVVTDSAAIQEETTLLGVPCLTMLETTERLASVLEGSNTLVGRDSDALLRHLHRIVQGDFKRARVPALWDGRSTQRIAAILRRELIGSSERAPLPQTA